MARGEASESMVSPHSPQVSLRGGVDDDSVTALIEQLRSCDEGDGPVTVEMTTMGGDAEAARRMVLEVDQARERLKSRRVMFLGKTTLYSAGVTFMAAFPREDRFLTRDTQLLIHCRQLEKTLEISGPMRGSRAQVEALLHEIDAGVELEVRNFERLIAGTDIGMEELLDKALYNWYLTADEALERGLVAELV